MDRLKGYINRMVNPQNGFMTVMVLMIAFVCIASTSFAFFTARAERKGALNIVTGNLYSFITSKSFTDEKEVVINPNDTRIIDVSMTNVNSIEAKLNFYYSATSENVSVGYLEEGDACPTEEGVALPKNGEEGDTKNYRIQITNNDTKAVTVSFGSNVGLANKTLAFPTDKKAVGKAEPKIEEGSIEWFIKEKSNTKDLTYSQATDEQKHQMFEIEHPDGSTSYRYIGSDPYNYVTFNDEQAGWRIIGITEEENASGVKEKRIKLIRDEWIGNTNYSWDNSNATTNGDANVNASSGYPTNNGNYGSNNWDRPAKLKELLNSGLYWNRQKGTCPYGQNNATTACDFSSTGLTTTSHDQIEDMKWYLGGKNTGNISLDDIYTAERGSETCKTLGNCTANRPTSTTGKVGLIYPSDYGYTYSKGISDTCTNNLGNCSNGTPTNGWMYKSGYNWWTIAPRTDYSYLMFCVNMSRTVVNGIASDTSFGVRPVVYLKSNIQLSGTGSEDSPYKIV